MTSFVPVLDDIEFDQLVVDGRSQIPRYAPDWTDHNLSDPGITLIDLLAWLTDQHIYRIGFVGDSLRAAFTRVMGIVPQGPAAAEMLVWPEGGVPVTSLRAGTQLRSPDANDARFTLTHDIRTVAPRIIEIYLWQDRARRKLGTGLTEGRDPLDLYPYSGGGPAMLEIELEHEITPLSDAGPVSLGLQMETEDGNTEWGAVTVEQQDDTGDFWHVLETEDLTGGLRKSGAILFYPNTAIRAQRLRIRLDKGFRPGLARLSRLALNVLPAREGVDDPGGVIGEGTGLPDQLVKLETDDIVDRETQLTIVTSSNGTETNWTATEDLSLSGPADAHFRLTPDGLLFGNGLNGRTIPPGSPIQFRPVRRTCGAEGAVAAGLRWSIAGTVFGTNITASTPGRNRDDLRMLIARARSVSRARNGLLSADEIRKTLLAAGLGLADVQVMARRRPGLDDRETPGARTVLLIPLRTPDTGPRHPSPRLRRRAERALAPLRLLGERLYVSFPIYTTVDISVTVIVDPATDVQAFRAEAEMTLRARLWDCRRHAEIAPWQPGRIVTVGEIESLLSRLPQASRIADCRIGPAGRTPGRDDIQIGDRGIALAGTVDIHVVRDGTDGAETIPVWIDISAGLTVQPGADRNAVKAAAEDAVRGWSQTGGTLSTQLLATILSGISGVANVRTIQFSRDGNQPAQLRPSEFARAGSVSVHARYPSDWGET